MTQDNTNLVCNCFTGGAIEVYQCLSGGSEYHEWNRTRNCTYKSRTISRLGLIASLDPASKLNLNVGTWYK